jgi:hypothetical protein
LIFFIFFFKVPLHILSLSVFIFSPSLSFFSFFVSSLSSKALSRESEVSNLLENERRAWSTDKQLLRSENKQLEVKVAGLSKRLGEELARAKKLDGK